MTCLITALLATLIACFYKAPEDQKTDIYRDTKRARANREAKAAVEQYRDKIRPILWRDVSYNIWLSEMKKFGFCEDIAVNQKLLPEEYLK